MRNAHRRLCWFALCVIVSAAGGCAMNIGQKNINPAAFNDNAPAGTGPTVADADIVRQPAATANFANAAPRHHRTRATRITQRRHRRSQAPLEPADITADVTPSQLVIPADALTPAHHALQVDALLGTVNGRPLFVSDLLRPIARKLHHEAAACRTCRDFRQQASQSIYDRLEQHISNLLMRDAARNHMSKSQRQGLEMYDKVEKAKLIAEYRGSAALADRALRLEGTSLARYLANKRRKRMVQLFLSERIAPRVVVTRRQIYEYYIHHMKQFTRRAELSLYTITMPVARQWPARYRGPNAVGNPPESVIRQGRLAALAYANHLEKLLREHKASFAELAEENSVDPLRDQGGHKAHFYRGLFNNKALENLAFSTPAHTMAPPQLWPAPHDPRRDMVIILRVGSVKPRRVIPFTQAQIAIKKRIDMAQQREYYADYYRRIAARSTVEEAVQHIVKTAANVAAADYYLCDNTNR